MLLKHPSEVVRNQYGHHIYYNLIEDSSEYKIKVCSNLKFPGRTKPWPAGDTNDEIAQESSFFYIKKPLPTCQDHP